MDNTRSGAANKEQSSGQIIRIEQEQLSKHLDKVVRGTVEETINALLDAEADRLCQASRYERTEKRRDTRAGHYTRNLSTKAGDVKLKVTSGEVVGVAGDVGEVVIEIELAGRFTGM